MQMNSNHSFYSQLIKYERIKAFYKPFFMPDCVCDRMQLSLFIL